MDAVLSHIQGYLIDKSPWFGGVYGVLFGTVAEISGVNPGGSSGNTALFVALCGLLGAMLASWPRIIAARAHARLSESEFVGSQTQGLIKTLRKQSSDNEQILGLQIAVRHDIQGHYQAAVWHIALLEDLLSKAGNLDVPKYQHADIASILRNMDKQIHAIRHSNDV